MNKRGFHDHNSLIDKLGGPCVLHRLLHAVAGTTVAKTAIFSWYVCNNIPDKYWIPIQKVYEDVTKIKIGFGDPIETAARNLRRGRR
jgi:hypothetical protein